MRLHTEAGFIKKSKEPCLLDEENPAYLVNKYHLLKSYYENLKATFEEYKKDKECDKQEHGRNHHRQRGKNIKFGYRQKNMIALELNRIGKEVDRLHRLIQQ